MLLGEFKHYKTRLAHGGIQKEVMASTKFSRGSYLFPGKELGLTLKLEIPSMSKILIKKLLSSYLVVNMGMVFMIATYLIVEF